MGASTALGASAPSLQSTSQFAFGLRREATFAVHALSDL